MSAQPTEKLRVIARHWLACQRLDHAEPLLRELLAIDPQDAETIHQLASVLLERGQLDEAGDLARTAISLYPDYAPAHASLAGVLIAERQPVAAIDCARTAVRLQLLLQHGPVEGFCLTQAATVFREIGRRTEGMQLLRSYIQREPNNPRAHEALGLACWNRGDVPGARRCFREALRINPQMERVRQILRMHSKTRPQDMPEGWVLTRYVDYRDNRGQKIRVILDEKRRPG